MIHKNRTEEKILSDLFSSILSSVAWVYAWMHQLKVAVPDCQTLKFLFRSPETKCKLLQILDVQWTSQDLSWVWDMFHGKLFFLYNALKIRKRLFPDKTTCVFT